MSQNVVQQRESIMQWIDHVRSPRFSDLQYAAAINAAIRKIVDDRYDNLREKKGYSFESIQRVRAELYTLVKTSSSIIATGAYLPIASFPTDQDYLLDIKVTIDDDEFNATPLTHDKKNIIEEDPFETPQLTYPNNVYYIEASTGLEILWGEVGTLMSGVFDYLAKPNTVFFGILHVVASGNFAVDTVVIANDVTVYPVGTTHQIGEVFTCTAATNITSGSVYHGYTNHNLPDKLEVEIAQLSASLLLMPPENFMKSKELEKNSERT